MQDLAVFIKHGHGHAALVVRIIKNHGCLHDRVAGITCDFHGHDTGHGGSHGILSVLKGETRGVVDVGRLVVVEGVSVHAAGLPLSHIWVFWSEIVVVVHAVAIHVLVHGVAGPVAVHVSGDAGWVERVGATLEFNTVTEGITVAIAVKRVACPIPVGVSRNVGGVNRVGATRLLVNVGPAIAVLVAVADIADTIAISVSRQARGQQAIGITIQFINIAPGITVIIVIFHIGDTVSVGVEENRFRFFVVDDVAATKTTGKDQHQAKQNG